MNTNKSTRQIYYLIVDAIWLAFLITLTQAITLLPADTNNTLLAVNNDDTINNNSSYHSISQSDAAQSSAHTQDIENATSAPSYLNDNHSTSPVNIEYQRYIHSNNLLFNSSTNQNALHYSDKQSYDQFAAQLRNDNDTTIRVGYLTNIHGRNNQQRQGIVISGAITYAIAKVNNDTSKLNGRRIELIANDTEGETLLGTSAILHQWRRGAMAFFGPEDSCETEATIASAINLPMISYKCADSKPSNKHFYRTFVRTHPPDTQIVNSVIALLSYFKWRKFSIISERSIQYQTVARNLADRARSSNFIINSESKFENIYACCVEHRSCCHDSLYNIIEETFKKTRIYVFLGAVTDLISMMQVMQVKNLIYNGDYLVIYVDLDQYSTPESHKYFWRSDMDAGTKKTMMEAARSLLVVVTSPPNTSTYTDFEESVRAHNALPPFNFKQPFPNMKKHITVYASYLYDAFMLYADALEETIKTGSNIHDGAAIVKRIINRKNYQSVTGAWMNIDSNGDVEGNYSVLALRPTPPDLKLKVNGGFNLTMLPVCNFYYENNTLMLTGTIDWVKGRGPPLDEPVCAYDGSICRKPPDFTRERIAVGQLIFLFAISVFVNQIYRNWKKEQEIAGLLWRMELDDLQLHQISRTKSQDSFSSRASSESDGYACKNAFTKTATYKGSIVAIKELKFSSKKDKDIPRASKIEMKQIKELRHDNINQFIGACINHECNSIYIVTEYCSKGSLQDILDNTDLKLDDMFVSSLVFDLLEGLNYLHNSDIKFHGNLKSSNCLITSRWTLKLTDFGLHNFRRAASASFRENKRTSHYRNQLWLAPELLRNPTLIGNQKTDIYAFGIILHEIVGRHGPFGIDQYSSPPVAPEDLVDSIKNPTTCCSSNLIVEQAASANEALVSTTISRQVNSISRADRPAIQHKQVRNTIQYPSYHRITSKATRIDPASASTADNRHANPGQEGSTKKQRFVQIEQLKHLHSHKTTGANQGAYASFDLPSVGTNLQHLGERRVAGDDEIRMDIETPFLGKNSENTASSNIVNNGSALGNRQNDTRILYRPDMELVQCAQYIKDTMRGCWAENPDDRPDLSTTKRRLERMRAGRSPNIMDNMMAMMETHANNLEVLVQERTAQLSEEKKKTEILLHRMLPPSVAAQLLAGEQVEKEEFNAVTIFFSDIVGFTEKSSKITSSKVFDFLHELYTMFDAIIRKYDVYKVETIGDAYMVVSGCPERISNHADEITSMAIEIVNSVPDFKIRHLPKEDLQLRIGLHTGSVTAGVMGKTMPRYCLAGDTVNTACRMEQHGEGLKIHASPATKQYLDKSGKYKLESRGLVYIKGKGYIETYWVLGYNDAKTPIRRGLKSGATNGEIALFDAISQIEGKKKSPRVPHVNQSDDVFKNHLNCYTAARS